MFILAFTSFAVLVAAGFFLEIATANAQSANAPRRHLNRFFSALWAYPLRAVRWHNRRREESYQARQPVERSTLSKCAMRAHFLVLIPLAAYIGAEALEAFAAGHKPIVGLYLSPEQAWYLGIATGGIFAAVAPLVAYMVFWFIVILPYTIVSSAAGLLGRLLINATGGKSGRGQAPFAILGVVLGLVAAGTLLAF